MVAIVETWHDGADSPDMLSTPTHYRFIEQARPRSDALSLSTNHEFMVECVWCTTASSPRYQFSCPVSQCLNHWARSCITVLSTLLPSLSTGQAHKTFPAPSNFFDELRDLLESVSSFAALLIIVGAHTHLSGHMLNLVLTRCDLSSRYCRLTHHYYFITQPVLELP
jgi:hypothetical protein